jgi:two-component system, NtrC family, sensor histidine kinase HydH
MDQGLKLRIQDVFLVAILGVLVFLAHDMSERGLISAIALLQLAEGRTPALATRWGRTLFVVLQLAVLWVLIGYTNGVESHYYLMMLFPLVSTASYSGFAGTLAVSIAGVGAYLSFLLYVNFEKQELAADAPHVLAIRCLMMTSAAIAVNSLAAVIRNQSARYRLTAEQLAEANRNLTEAEAQVRRSERLAALGQLSAGLAHELRNPLGSIKGSAELLTRSSAQKDPMTKELAGIISAEVDRTNSLVTRFLDFARPLEPRKESVDVTTVIDRAVARSNVEVTRDYSASLPHLAIDPELMEQVFLNLITNAAQASEAGARITIRTREIGRQAEIGVVDHGCGIPRDKIETIFNPFVTTKQAGVGLGLAIVAKIVDGHGGKMAVESEPGKGSTFRVLLPIPSKI